MISFLRRPAGALLAPPRAVSIEWAHSPATGLATIEDGTRRALQRRSGVRKQASAAVQGGSRRPGTGRRLAQRTTFIGGLRAAAESCGISGALGAAAARLALFCTYRSGGGLRGRAVSNGAHTREIAFRQHEQHDDGLLALIINDEQRSLRPARERTGIRSWRAQAALGVHWDCAAVACN